MQDTIDTALPPLDMPTARRLLAEVAGERPDFVYRPLDLGLGATCYYVPLPVVREEMERLTALGPEHLDDFDVKLPMHLLVPHDEDPRETTGCLVGVVLDRYGETRHRFHATRCDAVHVAVSGMFADEMVAQYLSKAQIAQDKGCTWAYALDRAEAWYRSEVLLTP